MSDSIEKIVAEMRSKCESYPLGIAQRSVIAWADRLASLRQVPEGWVLLPRRLTAENGAKGLLSGEFHETTRHTCASCDGDGYIDDVQCEECEGECSVEVKVPVSWDTIKQIHRTVVDNLAVEANPAPPTSGSIEDTHGNAVKIGGVWMDKRDADATPAQAGAITLDVADDVLTRFLALSPSGDHWPPERARALRIEAMRDAISASLKSRSQELPRLPQAFFDEFGESADDRVMDFARAYANSCAQAGAELPAVDLAAENSVMREALSKISRVNACDYEYVRWAREALSSLARRGGSDG